MKIYRIATHQWQEISSSRFTYEKYGCKAGYSDLDVFMVDETYHPRLKPGVTPVGYCRALALEFRPRGGFAVMVEINGEEIWFHCGEQLP